MAKPPKCKLCKVPHWSYEPHVWPGGAQSVTPKTVTETVTPAPKRNETPQTVTFPETVTVFGGAVGGGKTAYTGGRGHKVYENDAARQKAYRLRQASK